MPQKALQPLLRSLVDRHVSMRLQIQQIWKYRKQLCRAHSWSACLVHQEFIDESSRRLNGQVQEQLQEWRGEPPVPASRDSPPTD
jgi:hypothetical protein